MNIKIEEVESHLLTCSDGKNSSVDYEVPVLGRIYGYFLDTKEQIGAIGDEQKFLNEKILAVEEKIMAFGDEQKILNDKITAVEQQIQNATNR